MGQAKRRGTYDERVEQSRARQAASHEKWRAEREAAEKARREEYQRRVDAGEAIPLERPRPPSMLPMLLIAAAMGGMRGMRPSPRRNSTW